MCTQLLSFVQLFVTPWTVGYQAPLSTGFPRQEYWSGLPFPSSVDQIFLTKGLNLCSVQFSSVAQSCLTLCDPMTAARQASLSISNFYSLLKLMSIESVMPSNHLILCRPLLLLPLIFPSIRVFLNESALHIR